MPRPGFPTDIQAQFMLGWWLVRLRGMFLLAPSVGQRHPAFDLARALDALPLPGGLEGVRLSSTLSSPVHVAAIEHLRPMVSSQLLGEGVPVDVFLWAGTSDVRTYLTRMGGVPHRERGLAWPRDRRGRPLQFLAQFCFADSMDVLGVDSLPGEVLLVFAGADTPHVPMDDDPFVLEWSSIELREPMTFDDVPERVPEQRSRRRRRFPEWGVPELFGVRHRTVIYPDAFLEEDAPWEGDAGSFLLASPQATVIGSSAFYIQGEPCDDRRLIATLSSTKFARSWPLVDHEEPRGLEDFQFGNLGCYYVELHGDGTVRVRDQHY